MKLILHIGTEKTGTTSFQVWMGRNLDAAQAAGVWYARSLGTPDHRRLSVMARDPSRREDGFEMFGIANPDDHARFCQETEAELARDVAAARTAGARLFVISSEHLHSRLLRQEDVDRAAAIVKQHFDDVEVICFLRPPIEMALSLASTGARVGMIIERGFFEYVRPKNPFYNFAELLKRWGQAFGRDAVTPVPYARQRSTVSYFRDRLELEALATDEEPRVNAALDHRVIALSNHLHGTPESRFSRGDRSLTRFFIEDFPWSEPLTLGKPLADRLQGRFKTHNERVAHEWPAMRVEDLVTPTAAFPEKGTIETLEAADFSEQFQWLVRHFNARFLIARAEAAHLRSELAQAKGDLARAIAEAEDAAATVAPAVEFDVTRAKAEEIQNIMEDRIDYLKSQLLPEPQQTDPQETTPQRAGGLRDVVDLFRPRRG